MGHDRSYDDEEVRAIIDRALKTRPAGGLSHEDLLAVGAGVGLSKAAVESAATEHHEARQSELGVARVVSLRRRGVAAHGFVFLAVNAVLFAINFLTTPGQWWVLFSIFGWGLGLLLHAGFALSLGVSPRRLQREMSRLPKTSAPLRLLR